MLEKINLFPKVEAIWEKREKMRRLAQVGSIVVLVLYFFLLSSLLSYSLLLAGESGSLEKKIESYEGRVKELKAVESKQTFLKSKLKELAKILKLEGEPGEVLEDLEALTLPGINFLAINSEGEKIRINGEASDVLVLDEFVKHLEDEGRNLFSKAEFESVAKTIDGNYIFALSLLR